jgi:hypothetical protein
MNPEAIRKGEQPENKNSQVTIETFVKSKPSKTTVTNNHRYSAAVPISLYREVVAELQSAKTKLSALGDKNGRLKHQNQLLRREVQYLLKSTPTKKNVNSSFIIEPQKTQNQVVRERVPEKEISEKLAEKLPIIVPELPEMEKPFSKAEESRSIAEIGQDFPVESRSHRGMNGWILALAIILIVATAFTAGFLLVRPLIGESSDRK